MKYAPRKVYIKKDGDYVELSYQDFCRRRQTDQSYMDKLFIPVQGCLLEVVREQYTDFYRDKERWLSEKTCAELTATTKRRKLTERDHSIKTRLTKAKEQAKQPTVTEGKQHRNHRKGGRNLMKM